MGKLEVSAVLRQTRYGHYGKYVIMNIVPTNAGDIFILREIVKKMPTGKVKALKRSSLCDYRVIG